MSAITANKNRWGDPPLIIQGRFSPLAVIAVALAVVCVLVAGMATLIVASSGASAWSLSAAFMLLLFVQFPLVQLPVLMAYVMLCTCRPAGTIRGRGLAWAAIGLSYVALIWHLALAGVAAPYLKLAASGVLAMGAMHLPLFAAESRFAKNAIATLVIAGAFVALLLPWIVYTREESRRLRCANSLRQIGVQLQDGQTANGSHDLQSPGSWSTSDEILASSPLFQRITESSQPGANLYTIPQEPRRVEVAPTAPYYYDGRTLQNEITP